MKHHGLLRRAATAALMLAPLGLSSCAYPPYRYYSAPCAPAAPNTGGKPQVVPGTDGKQCVYAVPDYAAGPAGPYAYSAGDPYFYGPGYDGFYDGWDYGWDDPYWALGFGGFYGGYSHGFYRHGFHGGWGGFHGGWGGFHGGASHGGSAGGGGGHGR